MGGGGGGGGEVPPLPPHCMKESPTWICDRLLLISNWKNSSQEESKVRVQNFMSFSRTNIIQ